MPESVSPEIALLLRTYQCKVHLICSDFSGKIRKVLRGAITIKSNSFPFSSDLSQNSGKERLPRGSASTILSIARIRTWVLFWCLSLLAVRRGFNLDVVRTPSPFKGP
jgi:hypothetical protein